MILVPVYTTISHVSVLHKCVHFKIIQIYEESIILTCLNILSNIFVQFNIPSDGD